TAAFSECTSTPNGYKWVVTSCASPQTCNPAASACGATGFQAGCSTTCVPNQQRCSADLLSYQTCGANGEWGTITSCRTNPAAARLACRIDPSNALKTQCATPVCALGFSGTCGANGQFSACKSDGTLASAADCGKGTCVSLIGQDVLSQTPGACVVECQ